MALSKEAITKELLERYRDEQSWLPIKLEHAMDEAATVALLTQGDPEAASADAKRKLLARGIGVSFWLLDVATFEQWRGRWNGYCEPLERCSESGEISNSDASAVCSLSPQFWEVFEKPPTCEIALNMEFFDSVVAGNLSKEVWKTVLQCVIDSEMDIG